MQLINAQKGTFMLKSTLNMQYVRIMNITSNDFDRDKNNLQNTP